MKVFLSPSEGIYYENRFMTHVWSGPFQLEKNNFTFSNKIEECDIVGLLRDQDLHKNQIDIILKNQNIKYVFLLDLFHIYEESHGDIEFIKEMNTTLKKNKVKLFYIHTNIHSDPEVYDDIFYDYLWNRQKAAFTDFENSGLQNTEFFGSATNKMFELNEIKKINNPVKFLNVDRICSNVFDSSWNDRTTKRIVLKYILEKEDGLINDPERGISFDSQEILEDEFPQKFAAFSPVHTKYYESSYISIYVESLSYLNPEGRYFKSVTEKTWNPLLKGHFILPFGYNGLIENIQEYGFKLPTWINYGYDNISNDKVRFIEYIREVKRVVSKSRKELKKLYEQDRWILEHNRSIFFNKPFDNLYQKTLHRWLNTDQLEKGI